MKNPKNKKFSLLLSLLIFAFLVSMSFRIQHWPYGHELAVVSTLLIGIVYALRYSLKKDKSTKDFVKLILVASGVLLLVLISFKIQNLFYVRFALILSGIVWLTLECYDIIKRRNQNERISVIAWLVILCAIFLLISKVFNLRLSIFHQLIGTLILSVGFLSEWIMFKSNQIKNR